LDKITKTADNCSSAPSITKNKPNGANGLGTIEKKQFSRLGFMKGEGRVPDDFNTMGSKEIEDLFSKGR
jgi:hypothetical protein